MGANESSLEGDAMAQEADDSSSSLSATGAASAYDAPPEPPEAEAPAEAATSPGDEPPELLCPITLSMMGDPVVANDGHSYERAAIAAWLATHDTPPRASRWAAPRAEPRARAQIGEWRAARGLPAMPERWIPPAAPRPRQRRLAAARSPGGVSAAPVQRARGRPAGPSTPRAHHDAARPPALAPQRRRAGDAATPYADRRDYVERFSPLHRVVGCARPPDFDPRPSCPTWSRARTRPTAAGASRRRTSPRSAGRRALAALLRAGADPALPQRGLPRDLRPPRVRHKRLDALRALLDVVGRAPAVVDARTTDGSTPLHLAAAVGSREATEALLDAGAALTRGPRRRLAAAWRVDERAPRRGGAPRARRGGRRRQARRVDAAPPLREPGPLRHGDDPPRGRRGQAEDDGAGSTPADRAALFRDDRLVRSLS
ncbi:hypothetical protein JL720_5232 [Aureococcus anophagefferens]|nr:hypothetical protein JL720_5232 [Aureococcus anophagefferens]